MQHASIIYYRHNWPYIKSNCLKICLMITLNHTLKMTKFIFRQYILNLLRHGFGVPFLRQVTALMRPRWKCKVYWCIILGLGQSSSPAIILLCLITRRLSFRVFSILFSTVEYWFFFFWCVCLYFSFTVVKTNIYNIQVL